jgi:MFS superfamily sulfate permease-like transporter
VGVLVGLLLLAVLGAFSASASVNERGRRNAANALVGASVVVVAVVVSLRVGVLWGALVLGVLMYLAAQHLPRRATEPRSTAPPGPAPSHRRMTRSEALRVLGLESHATASEILAEYRRLMKKMHPDVGGSAYFATQINEARDVLLGR